LSDLPGLVPPALPRWAMPLVLWRTCPRVTYFPHIITHPPAQGKCVCCGQCAPAGCSGVDAPPAAAVQREAPL